MAKYRVNLVNVGSFSVVVEADSEDEAIDMAFEEAPRENIHTGFDVGDWTFASDLWPNSGSDDDVELIGE